MDPIILARIQFAITAAYHYLFVPVNVGLGLIVALFVSRSVKTKAAEDIAAAKWWVKLFAITFAMGVATGITMEFSFGTNWANYSRFVGDIFGAPLAAEALLAFFMESTFLGVLLWGRNRVSDGFYKASAWLVFAGSVLSCLWILIANSWMQTPAGYSVEGGKAVLDSFFAAAFNPTTLPRFVHTVTALIITGSFITVAVGAYHMLKGQKTHFASRMLAVGSVVALVATIVMLPASHWQAAAVAEHQPEKLAAMEGQYEDGPADLYLFGWVDTENQTVHGIKLMPGGTSLLAWGDPSRETIGLNSAQTEFERRIAEIEGDADYTEYMQQINSDTRQEAAATAPVQITFQSYHLMIILYGFIVLWVIFSFLANNKVKKGGTPSKGLLKALMWAPLFPMLAIEAGWLTAEFGRQPWIVWKELLVVDAVSPSVDAIQLLITLVLFAVVYSFLLIMFLKNALRIIKEGPADVEGAM